MAAWKDSFWETRKSPPFPLSFTEGALLVPCFSGTGHEQTSLVKLRGSGSSCWRLHSFQWGSRGRVATTVEAISREVLPFVLISIKVRGDLRSVSAGIFFLLCVKSGWKCQRTNVFEMSSNTMLSAAPRGRRMEILV